MDSILQSPKLTALRIDLQIQPLRIRNLIRLLSGLGISDRGIGQRHLGASCNLGQLLPRERPPTPTITDNQRPSPAISECSITSRKPGVFQPSATICRQVIGGPSRNRTGVRGFAVRYVTTPPSGLMPNCRILSGTGRVLDAAASERLSRPCQGFAGNPSLTPVCAVRCGLGCPAVDSYARRMCGSGAVLPLQYSMASAKAACN